MGSELDKISFYKKSIIDVEGGNIYHVIKNSNKDIKFEEIYFSSIKYNFIKGWKLHEKMTSNLFVPQGDVQFIFVSKDFRWHKKYILGEKNYGRLHVPPNVWFCFKGVSNKTSLILNLSSMEHDVNEIKRIKLNEFPLKIKI